jgi:hypothetical protein
VLMLVAALAIVALAAREWPSSEPRARTGAPLPAVLRDGWLARLDPRSLQPLPGRRVRLRGPIEAWAREPGGPGLVVVSESGSRLRFVNLDRMRAAGELRSGASDVVAAVAWPRPDRLWLVLARPGCCATGRTSVVTVDPIRRRVVAETRFRAGLARAGATPDGAVLLLAPSETIGPAMLATVDEEGRARTVPLTVSAGLLPTEGVPFILRTRLPGLAVDARRRRAYVVPDRPEVLEVDLRTRRVLYHRVAPRRSLLDRLRDLVEPPAEAQPPVGPARSAAWLPPGTIAVAGVDSHVSWRPNASLEPVARPAGLQLIDARRWEVRTLDDGAAGFRAAGGLVLTDGDGLAGYRADGSRAFHVLGDRRVKLVAASGGFAYLRDGAVHRVVELDAGRVVATIRNGWPRLMLVPAPGPWGAI